MEGVRGGPSLDPRGLARLLAAATTPTTVPQQQQQWEVGTAVGELSIL